jgi:hypothetical protein
MTDHLTATLALYGLRCEHQVAPLGIGTRAPLLSWRLGTTRRGDDPVSCRVVVTAVSSGDETVHDDWTASWITPDPSDVDVVDAPDEGDVALPDHGLRPPVELRQGRPARRRLAGGARLRTAAGRPRARTVQSGRWAEDGRHGAARCDRDRARTTADPGGVRERGLPVRETAGVRGIHVEPGTLVCRLTSGDFPFTAAAPPPQEKP